MEQRIPPAIVAAIQKAQKLIHAGKLAKAEDTCRKILKTIPEQPDTLHLLGLIALRNGQYERTQICYKKALKTHPDNPAYHYNLGIAYIHTEQYKSAIESLKRAIEIQPDLKGLYSDLCFALERAGNFEAAIEAGKKALLQAPDDANTHYHLALAYQGWKNFESSFKHHLKACQLSPDSPELLFGLGNAYLGRNEVKAAKKCYLHVLQLVPTHILALYSVVNCDRYTTTDHEDLRRLKTLEKKDNLTDEDRTSIYFSLAKIYQDCELYDKAFYYFEHGNALQAKKYPFSSVEFTDYVSSMIEFHTKEQLEEKSLFGNPSNSPVFIVGTVAFDPTGREGMAQSFATSIGVQAWNDSKKIGMYDQFTTGTSTNANKGTTPSFTLTGSALQDDGFGGWTGTMVSAGNINGGNWTGFGNVQFSEVFNISITEAAVIPVPAAAWLFGSGLLGLVGVARRRKSS